MYRKIKLAIYLHYFINKEFKQNFNLKKILKIFKIKIVLKEIHNRLWTIQVSREIA